MRWIRYLTTLLFGIILAVAVYLLMAVLLSLLPTHPPELECEKNTEIFISTNGVHLDIILPVGYLNDELIRQLELSSETNYVAFGWGDKQFYLQTPQWSDLTIPVAFRAVFLKSESAMHVTRYRNSFRSWFPLHLCPDQLNELKSYINDSFEVNSDGDIIPLQAKGYSYNDTFYEAKGSFSLFITCNVWVNKALKEIDVQTAVWSPFDFGVLHHLR